MNSVRPSAGLFVGAVLTVVLPLTRPQATVTWYEEGALSIRAEDGARCSPAPPDSAFIDWTRRYRCTDGERAIAVELFPDGAP